MKDLLRVFGIIPLVFLAACEAEFPVQLESTGPEDIINQLPKEAKSATTPINVYGDKIEGEYIVLFREDLPVFERMDAQTSSQRRANQRMSPEQSEVLAKERTAVIESYLRNTLTELQINPKAVLHTYDAGRIKGGLLAIDQLAAETLAQDNRFSIVEPNEVMALSVNPGSKGRLIPADNGPAYQYHPWNVFRVGGSRDMSNSPNSIFIIDSGVDMDHPDLNVSQTYSRSFVPYDSSPDDGYGHGSHVAGTAGAKNDGAGIVGVAAGATIISYRVLDDNGYGSKDYLMNAIAHLSQDCIAGDVVNISLGTEDSPALNSVIEAAKTSLGIQVVISAGNEGSDVSQYSPANLSAEGIYVVGGLSIFNTLVSFSNYGTTVGYVAPGQFIYSTYKDGQYAWMNGTSMAAPHLAGILLAGNGQYDENGTLLLPSGNYAKIVYQTPVGN